MDTQDLSDNKDSVGKTGEACGSGDLRNDALAALRAAQKSWYRSTLGQLPLQWGNVNARIVLVSQAPSQKAILNQKPFTDASGRRLRRDWLMVEDRVFWDPNIFYFTAVSLAFPGRNHCGADMKPSIQSAKIWLNRELYLLRPEIFIIVGSVPAGFFYPGIPFKDLISRDQTLLERMTVVLPHPSPRNRFWLNHNEELIGLRLMTIRHYVHQAIAR